LTVGAHRQIRGIAGRIAPAAAILLFLLTPAAAIAQSEEATVSLRGRIIDETGEGVAGQVVRLLKSRTYVKIAGLRSLDQSVEDARATTDSLGFFEFEYRPDRAFPYSYLRFYDPKTFDAVKYSLPEDRDVSKKLRSGRPVQVTVSLRFQPEWPRVKTLLDSFPAGSQVGQILRSLGLPSSRAPEGPGRELWTYNKAGVSYLVEGARIVETRQLPGGAKSTAGEPGKDEPAPAVRMDGP
jgi:hypothetical protein